MGLRGRWQEWARARGEQQEQRVRARSTGWADPPRDTTWRIASGGNRTELSGPGGLLMTYKPGIGIIGPEGGRTLVTVRQHALGGEARSWRVSDLLDGAGRNLRPWSIEVEDNFLPAEWLFGIIHTCALTRGALGRH